MQDLTLQMLSLDDLDAERVSGQTKNDRVQSYFVATLLVDDDALGCAVRAKCSSKEVRRSGVISGLRHHEVERLRFLVDDDAALGLDFFEVPMWDRVGNVEAYCEKTNVARIVQAFEVDLRLPHQTSRASRSGPRGAKYP